MTFKKFKKEHKGGFRPIAAEDIPGFYKKGSSMYGDCDDMIVVSHLYQSLNGIYTVYLKNPAKTRYLETRYYDNGSAEARLTRGRPAKESDDNTGKYDFYIEEIGEDADYESLEEWIEQLCIELDDIVPIILDLDAGQWVDITPYI
ncbi:MAG TPA: hypothetical protein DEQ02_00025 [Ruminococcaceae bacterium]|nr:hypothetical protein [Oscillospiraceae bacterium]